MSDLLSEYESKKQEIERRLSEFKQVLNQPNEKVFAELCFCLCTPQSKARLCDEAIRQLESSGLLFTGSKQQIEPVLRKVRFPKNKCEYILSAREMFSNGRKLKERIKSFDDPFELRGWLVDNVLGLGWKEASHFLRNIGLGEQFAILDVHILKNLKGHGVIDSLKPPSSKKQYLEIEERMRLFAKDIGIPLAHLDLLFWSRETGEIFK